MVTVVSGIIALILSITVGAYRQFCTFMEVKAPWNIPFIWRRSAFRIISWVFVAGSSIWGAFIVAGIIMASNDFIGKFSFGILLLMRWYVSAQIGITKAKKNLAASDLEMQADDYKEILAEGERMKQEYIRSRKEPTS